MNTRSTLRTPDDIMPVWDRLRATNILRPGNAIVYLYPPEPMRNGTRCIFVEGTAAVGKTTVLNELQTLGFQTTTEDFLGICNAYDQYEAGSLVHNVVFLYNQVNLIPRSALPFSEEALAIPHGQLHFFDRSPFSSAVYTNDPFVKRFMVKTMDQITNYHDCLKVLLTAPEDVVNQRINSRFNRSNFEDRLLRRSLGEQNRELQQDIAQRYRELANEGHFDWIIDATNFTDTVQALLCISGGPTHLINGLPRDPDHRKRLKRLSASSQ